MNAPFYSAAALAIPLEALPMRHRALQAKRRLVLVVEDEPDIRSIVAEYLRAEGYDVCLAQDGEMAMQVVRERLPDVVCLDLNLPRISGYDVCEQIRADPTLKDVSILITSARHSLSAMVFSLEAGADAYLAKPYGLKQLKAEIGRLFEMRTGERIVSDARATPKARNRAFADRLEA